MNIIFSHKKLRDLAANPRKCKKEMGEKRATLFFRRLTDLHLVESLDECRFLPGNFHELTHNRKGQWACNLDHPYRLIFTPIENPIPMNQSGQYIWFEIKGIEIIEIADYHE